MSLRKSPNLTPALLAANRRNAQKSTGPRTARGKAGSRLNRLRNGNRSREYRNLLTSLLHAPPGKVGLTAQALLGSKLTVHPLFRELAELCVRTEVDLCADIRREFALDRRVTSFSKRSKPEGR